ncbi:hypothetical protein ABZ070_02300 [Streptomyces sp. NPDC006283]|uniref:DUF6907 domain-containing protein n=1 Tax=Streptomyces sp. NPDC006283 TaxID=3156741 RepID=UPI0033A9CC5F
MTGQRTVTVPTLDRGDITIPEPAWCAGHQDQPTEAFVDLSHRGPEHQLGDPTDPIAVAFVSQFPHGTTRRETGLYVEQTGLAITLDPNEVERLAADFTTAEGQLRRLAAWLRILRGGA